MSVTERRRTSARRDSLLGDQPGAFASARFVRITPMKARRVVDMVRGLPVDDALALLQFAPQAASETVYKVLESAVANAETTEDLDRGSLVVSKAIDALVAAAGYAIAEWPESNQYGLMAFLRAVWALTPRLQAGPRPVSQAGGGRGSQVRPPLPWRAAR